MDTIFLICFGSFTVNFVDELGVLVSLSEQRAMDDNCFPELKFIAL